MKKENTLPATANLPSAVEAALMQNDLSKLTPEERTAYYKAVCDSISINWLTQPFGYIVLNNRLALYAKKDCTEQLRKRDNVSITALSDAVIEGVYVVTAKAASGKREDASKGAVNIQGLKGDALANAMMKAETKAKRRVTLSICGLGLPDESEIDSIQGAKIVDVNYNPGGDMRQALVSKLPASLENDYIPGEAPEQPKPTSLEPHYYKLTEYREKLEKEGKSWDAMAAKLKENGAKIHDEDSEIWIFPKASAMLAKFELPMTLDKEAA